MANRIEKGKRTLVGLGIVLSVLALALFAGGIFLFMLGAKADSLVTTIIMIIVGIVMICVSVVGILASIRFIWVGGSLVATKGSTSQDNIAKGSMNVVKCPKCGCTNTIDAKECANCKEPLV